jgi:hypothetical protein
MIMYPALQIEAVSQQVVCTSKGGLASGFLQQHNGFPNCLTELV